MDIYETHFSYKQILVKLKDVKNPWMSRVLEKLYAKYLKQKTTESKKTYKDYKNLFNKLTKKGKSSFYQNIKEIPRHYGK